MKHSYHSFSWLITACTTRYAAAKWKKKRGLSYEFHLNSHQVSFTAILKYNS